MSTAAVSRTFNAAFFIVFLLNMMLRFRRCSIDAPEGVSAYLIGSAATIPRPPWPFRARSEAEHSATGFRTDGMRLLPHAVRVTHIIQPADVHSRHTTW